MNNWLFENWYLVGFGITLVFTTVTFVVAGAYYWSAPKVDQGGYLYFYLATSLVAFVWIISLPTLGLICIGRIAYLSGRRCSGDKDADETQADKNVMRLQ